MVRRLLLLLALPACGTPPPTIPARALPESIAVAEPEPIDAEEPELFGFWLLGQSSWQGTLYGVTTRGDVREAETITSHDLLWTEPVGTLHWVEGCADRSGCRVKMTCPIAGQMRRAPKTAPTSPCEPFVLDLRVTCSDDRERHVRATFDGACEAGSAPSAHIYVNGEPGTDGRLPGWDRITAARYRICPSSESCRAAIAGASEPAPVPALASPWGEPRRAARRLRPPRALDTLRSPDRATDGNGAF